MNYLEYTSSSGEPWRIDKWPALKEAFGLDDDQAPQWHDAFAGKGRVWLILRRLFSVAGVFNEDTIAELDGREWSAKDIGLAIAISEALVLKELTAAQEFWQRDRHGLRLQQSIAEIKDAEDGKTTTLNLYQDLELDDVAKILTQINFNHIKGESKRIDIADRALSLREFLEDKSLRATAKQIIGMEVAMQGYEDININLTNTLQEKNKDDDEARELHKDLRANQKELRTTAEKHAALCDKIGASNVDRDKLERRFHGGLSMAIEGSRKWFQEPENALLDGVFTAKEINWQLTRQESRPAQYRPDIVLRIREAMTPENFCDPNYKPTVIEREACRKLEKIMKYFDSDQESDETDYTIPGLDDATLDEEDTSNASPLPPEANHPDQDHGNNTPIPSYHPPSFDRSEESCVVT